MGVRFPLPLPQAVYTLVASQMYYVYILQSKKDQGLYIGYTHNLKKRLAEHNKGMVISTKTRLPLTLVHYEGFICQQDALNTEKYLKTTRGWERINRMLEQTLGL